MAFSKKKKRLKFYLAVLLIMSFLNSICPGVLFAEQAKTDTVSVSQEDSLSTNSELASETKSEETDESVTTSVYNDNEDNEPIEPNKK
jgi:hypothetical protein